MSAGADPDLLALAQDELDRALSLSWLQLSKVTPWGDTFDALSPAGREVQVERSYVWAGEAGGDILCEVTAFVNAPLYDNGAQVSRRVAKPG